MTIRVIASEEGGDLVLSVADTGGAAGKRRRAEAADTGSAGTGVGLANTRRRIEVLYGARGSLDSFAEPHGYVAVIRLPLGEAPRLELVA